MRNENFYGNFGSQKKISNFGTQKNFQERRKCLLRNTQEKILEKLVKIWQQLWRNFEKIKKRYTGNLKKILKISEPTIKYLCKF